MNFENYLAIARELFQLKHYPLFIGLFFILWGLFSMFRPESKYSSGFIFNASKEAIKEQLEYYKEYKAPLICYLFFIRIHPILLTVISLPFLFNRWFFGGDLEKTQRALTIIIYLMLHALIAEFFHPHNIRIIKDCIKDIKEQIKVSKASQKDEVQDD